MVESYKLQTHIDVNGVLYELDTDYRTALLVLEMYADNSIPETEKHLSAIEILLTVEDEDGNLHTDIPEDVYEAAVEVVKYLNIGESIEENKDDYYKMLIEEKTEEEIKLEKIAESRAIRSINYKRDEGLIASALNKMLGYDIRGVDYMHWWTFVSLCQEIDNESRISTVVSIRDKLIKGDSKGKLTKEESRFVAENYHLFSYIEEEKYRIYLETISGDFTRIL